MADNSGKTENDEDQIAKEVVEYLLNTIEKDKINNECKLASPENEKTSSSKIAHQSIHLTGNNQIEINYDGDDEKGDDDNSNDDDSFDVIALKPPLVPGRMSSNNDQSTSNNATIDRDQASGSTTNDYNVSNDTIGRNNQLQGKEDAVENNIQGNILASPLSREWESDEYHDSPDSDYYHEITIDNDRVIDDRTPDQDHVKERILYCDACIERDDDVSGENCVTCLCFDCEKYLCRTCSMNCSNAEHLIAHTEDYESQRRDLCQKMVEQLSSEDDDSMIARMNRERFVCTGKVDVADQDEEPNKINITGMCYSEDGSKIALIDDNFMKLFNGYSYKLTRVIDFSDNAYGITEVPYYIIDYTPEKVSYFAITFPDKGQIMLVDIERNDDPIVKYIQLDGKVRQLWPRDIYFRHDFTLIVVCWHSDRDDATQFSIEEVVLVSGDLCHLNFSLAISSLPGPITADEDYLDSEFKLAIHKGSFTYFISSETNGYIKHITYDTSDSNSERCKAFVSNPAVDSLICVDKKKNVFASIGDESHEHGIYTSDEDLKIWKLCIHASEYMAGNSTLGMVHKDRLFLLTKSEDGRQYITIFQNEVSDRGYGEGSPL